MASKLLPEEWESIRKMVCAGKPADRVADAFGIPVVTLLGRAKKEKWKIAKVMPEKVEVAPSEDEFFKILPPVELENGIFLKKMPDLPEKFEEVSEKQTELHSELLSLLDASPADFQSGLAKVAQLAMVMGAASVPPPRNVNELAKWQEIHRKASGLDVKANGPANTPLVNPMRTVTRRAASPVVEVESAEDFEV